jgi:hypothetical protein
LPSDGTLSTFAAALYSPSARKTPMQGSAQLPNAAARPSPISATVAAVGGFCLSATLVFGSLRLSDGLGALPLLGLTGCALALMLRMRNRLTLPTLLRPFRLLLVLAMLATLGIAWLTTWVRSMEVVTLRAACGPALECRTYERGGFGGTWTDLVVRKSHLGVVHSETPLAHFDREGVLSVHFDASTARVVLEVAAYGHPPRTVSFQVNR